MRQLIDKQRWSRREYFDFFGAMEDPCYGVVANVDVTECYNEAKCDKAPFSLYIMHRILRVVDAIEEFHYRVEEGEIVRYDTIHSGPTVGRADGSFGFAFMEYVPDRREFVQRAQAETLRVQALAGLCLTPDAFRCDLIHYSAVPWFSFTEMKHPGSKGGNNGVPRISTGRLITLSDERRLMPVSLDVHHGLMDGFHAGQFFRLLEDPAF